MGDRVIRETGSGVRRENKAVGFCCAKLGMVNFINTAPIYVPWQEMGPLEGWLVEEGHPTLLNRHLDQGELDAGIISSYAYGLDADKYYMLPDLGISAAGPVGSVILLSKVPIERLNEKVVLLTPQSATSINLLHIILEDFLGLRPMFRTGSFRQLQTESTPQAYLAIGDEALRLRSVGNDLFQSDLAEIWMNYTGLPFVFAVWAVREQTWISMPDRITLLYRRLCECYHKGRKDLEHISRSVASRIPMTPSACLKYLKGIELDLSKEKRHGLLRFFKMLHKRGDFPEVVELRTLPLDGLVEK